MATVLMTLELINRANFPPAHLNRRGDLGTLISPDDSCRRFNASSGQLDSDADLARSRVTRCDRVLVVADRSIPASRIRIRGIFMEWFAAFNTAHPFTHSVVVDAMVIVGRWRV
ncbi:hypothetical protein Pla52o_11910 [Novipirellula galeiformis]|uniref:Uncharacterized protein n=1 Tax=Novipirellula galeiformis TaxID=2528004 RepID=A0A5C6CLE0_9BACT|nr:hypothetical protein [Novipirellula galeiformis]TWU24895.1 hypothetical protein Pla52o_11910 [Novipirellula galeiformis]